MPPPTSPCRHCGARRPHTRTWCQELQARLPPAFQALWTPLGTVRVVRQLPDGRLLTVERLDPHGVCLAIGEPELIADAWLYPTFTAAFQAALQWDGLAGEPAGWTHHPVSGRRRPAGDPAREYRRL